MPENENRRQVLSTFFRGFSNVRSLLSQCNTQLRPLRLLYYTEVIGRKTITHDFSMFYFTNKEASTVLCSVVKYARSRRAPKKCRGKHNTESSVPHVLAYGMFGFRHREKKPKSNFRSSKDKRMSAYKPRERARSLRN